jgi:hypothetical protein
MRTSGGPGLHVPDSVAFDCGGRSAGPAKAALNSVAVHTIVAAARRCTPQWSHRCCRNEAEAGAPARRCKDRPATGTTAKSWEAQPVSPVGGGEERDGSPRVGPRRREQWPSPSAAVLAGYAPEGRWLGLVRAARPSARPWRESALRRLSATGCRFQLASGRSRRSGARSWPGTVRGSAAHRYVSSAGRPQWRHANERRPAGGQDPGDRRAEG